MIHKSSPFLEWPRDQAMATPARASCLALTSFSLRQLSVRSIGECLNATLRKCLDCRTEVFREWVVQLAWEIVRSEFKFLSD